MTEPKRIAKRSKDVRVRGNQNKKLLLTFIHK